MCWHARLSRLKSASEVATRDHVVAHPDRASMPATIIGQATGMSRRLRTFGALGLHWRRSQKACGRLIDGGWRRVTHDRQQVPGFLVEHREIWNTAPVGEAAPLEIRYSADGPAQLEDHDGIADSHHDERDRRCRLVDSLGGGCPGRDDHVHLSGKQLRDEDGKPLVLALRPAILDDDISPLDVAQFAQALPEWADEVSLQGGGGVSEETDPVNFGRRVRLGGERRGEEHRTRASKERAAVYHSIT